MRLIDGEELQENLEKAITIMRIAVNAFGGANDPEMNMEIKAYTDILNGVKEMPSIQPEPRTGKWIPKSEESRNDWKCNQCGVKIYGCGYDVLPDFCPGCGSDMRMITTDKRDAPRPIGE